MNIRILKEEIEKQHLSPFATKSVDSLGRDKKEEKCDIRTCFQRDRDRIIHSKAFRRLRHKTQVFTSPMGDHYRTRLTHTFEVSQIARSIASALFLNEDLTEAIALGHDLGHTPFGHIGEDVLRNVFSEGFHHNEQSVRVVQKIEKNGEGLNLSKEVIDGILTHRGAYKPNTLEGKVVQISDKIAYVNHDIDDAIRAGLLTEDQLSKEYIQILGDTSATRINFLIRNIIENSSNKNDIILTEDAKTALYGLRKFLFANVYKSEHLKKERKKYSDMLTSLYEYYNKNFDKLPKEFTSIFKDSESKERIVCDYIAGMTDRFAINKFKEIGL